MFLEPSETMRTSAGKCLPWIDRAEKHGFRCDKVGHIPELEYGETLFEIQAWFEQAKVVCER